MYCGNCGTKNDDNAVYCEECGAKLVKGQETEKPKPQFNRKMTGVIVFLVTAIILMDIVVHTKDMVQVQKSDLDIIIGTWSNDDENVEFVFYAPENEGEKSGDLEYTDSGNVYYGTYELRESSRRLILTLTEISGWQAEYKLSMEYKIIDYEMIEIVPTEYPDSTLELEKVRGDYI